MCVWGGGGGGGGGLFCGFMLNSLNCFQKCNKSRWHSSGYLQALMGSTAKPSMHVHHDGSQCLMPLFQQYMNDEYRLNDTAS